MRHSTLVCTACRRSTPDIRLYRLDREGPVRAVRLLALCQGCREPVEALLAVPGVRRSRPAAAAVHPSAATQAPDRPGDSRPPQRPDAPSGRPVLRLVR